MFDWLNEARDGAVVTLTLNRPERMNALADEGDGAAFQEVFSRLNQDETLRCIILTGAGKAFSAGGNVKDMLARRGGFAGSQNDIIENYRHNVHQIVKAVWYCDVPIIAAVNGAAMGLGHDLAGYCDMRLASDKARFGSPFTALGLIPGDGGAWLLPRRIGMARAAFMFYTNEIISAQTALEWGLVSEIMAGDKLLPRAQELAHKIASQPPLAIKASKKLMREAMGSDLDAALEMAAQTQAALHHSDDHIEALKAFFDKRPGDYRGS